VVELVLTRGSFSSTGYHSCQNSKLQFGARGLRLKSFNVNSDDATVDTLLTKKLYNQTSTLVLEKLRSQHSKINEGFNQGILKAQDEIIELKDLAIRESMSRQGDSLTYTVVLSLLGFFVAILVLLIVVRVCRRGGLGGGGGGPPQGFCFVFFYF